MSKWDKILDPFEKVIWTGKPDKKAFLMQALGGIPFALIFLAFALFMLTLGVPFFDLPIILLIVAFGLIIVPPVWRLRKFPNCEYMITNQRLLIKSGIMKDGVWFVKLDKIKEIIVKKGIIDKILGTGYIYPITAEYPYAPKLYAYTSSDFEPAPWKKLKKVYNIADGKYEEITEWELYRKTTFHPHLEALNQPYRVQKLLNEAIKNIKKTQTT